MSDLLHVLIVDDHRDSADSLALLLRLHGYDAAVAYDGHAALAAARARRTDAVVLDLAMPGQGGDELARRLRREPGLESVTLICLSGYGRDEDRRRTKEAGCDHHLLKPVAAEELLAVLAAARNGAAPDAACGS